MSGKFPYRLYTEPKYGEVSPEVKAPKSHMLDFDNLAVSRARCNAEVYCEIQEAIRGCACYDSIMSVSVTNQAISADGRNIPFRIYTPEGCHERMPIVLFSHGGSFMMNSLDVYDNVCRYLSWNGSFAVVEVDYHLAPEYKYPAGLEDCYAVLKWAHENADTFDGDAEQLYLCGDSSGGNFAAVLAMMVRDRKELRVQKQVLIYPVTVIQPTEKTESELRYGTGYYLEYDSSQNPFGPYCNSDDEKEQEYLSPLYSDRLQNLPEALFVQAECDPLLDQGLMYAAKLEDAGNTVHVTVYEGMLHGFISLNFQKTFEALNEVCEFIHG